jgi:putative transposase
VSVPRVEDVTEALWGSTVCLSTSRELNQEISAQIETLAESDDRRNYPYVFLDGLWPMRSKAGTAKRVTAGSVTARDLRRYMRW